MDQLKPLPGFLKQRYHGWKATNYAENHAWYERLANEGQRPRAMVISCCDSRVHVTSIFGADPGELFIHRNIASLVPPCQPDGAHHGTSAAVEFAVTVLNVAHLIVLGHSQCGGVRGCFEMCRGTAPELERSDSFVGRWMDILKPKYDQIADIENEADQILALERLAVLTSFENLMTFPFVKERHESGKLSLHGLRLDIGAGVLEFWDSEKGGFGPV